MNKRTKKKRAYQWADWFSRNKIPLAYQNEADRQNWVSA